MDPGASPDDVWDMPALDPPPNVVPDLAHPGGQGEIAIAVTILCGVIAGMAFCLRLGSRLIARKIDIEDCLFISALGLYAGFLYEIYFMGSRYYHVHQWNVSLRTLSDVLFRTHIMSLLYGLSIMLIKIAILLSWVRLFVPTKERNAFFWVSHALIWSNILFYGIGTLTEIFQCTPRQKIWNPLYVGGSCPIDISKHAKASGFINLLSDLIILILPQKVIWGLHVSRKQKIGMSLLFVVGVFATVAATIRIYYLFKTYDEPDFLYNGSDLVLWMVAEIAAGFLIMGFPSLPKVFKSLPGSESMLSFFRSLRGSSGKQTNSRRGLPSWFKPQSQRRRGDPMAVTGISMGDTQTNMVFLTSPDMGRAMSSRVGSELSLKTAHVRG